MKAEIDFFILDCHVYTSNSQLETSSELEELEELEITDNNEYIKESAQNKKQEKDQSQKNIVIVIEIESELNSHSSIIEASEKARPRYLIILSILSFFTGEVFTVSQTISSSSHMKSLKKTNEIKTLFIHNGINKTDDLNKLLYFINTSNQSSRRLIYSLFDRWRKALYLETESEDNFLYEDEALLAYYHILELLSSEYEPQLKKDAETLVGNFLEKLLCNIYSLTNKSLEDEKKHKTKLIKEILISEIPIKIKIYYMLKKLKMLNGKSKQIVEKLIKDRNAVAHGREVYQDNIIYPLPPFFPVVKDISDEIVIAREISARAIASHLDLGIWKKEWINLLKSFPVAYEEVNIFVQNKSYINFSSEEFLQGKTYKIRPSDIYYYTVAGKIKLSNFQEIVSKVIIETEVNKRNALKLLGSCILLSDSQKSKLCEKCRLIIKTSYDKKWIMLSDLRDSFLYLEYKGFSANWIRQLLYS